MDDLISRQSVLDLVNDCGICIQKIVDLPSINPQKTGWWLSLENGNPFWRRCSECDATRRMIDYYENYCPNCGAKMSENPTD